MSASVPMETGKGNLSDLKRTTIDHLVVTLVTGVMSGFLFLVWHLYSNLEKRVSDLEKDTAASLLVLKESAINARVRLDLLDRNDNHRVTINVPTTNTIRVVEQPKVVAELSPAPPTTSPAALLSQQQRYHPLEAIDAAREDLRKKINETKSLR